MGSFQHPRVYGPIKVKSIRDVYREILDEIDQLYVFPVTNQNLKATIIERILICALEGTPQDEWKSKVLSSLR